MTALVLRCDDCRGDAGAWSGHYYTLRADMWRSIAGERDILCLDCCEARLGRLLTEDMFVALPSEIMARFAGETAAPVPRAATGARRLACLYPRSSAT